MNKNANLRKKLCLDKETLRTLDVNHLIDVVGGVVANAPGARPEIPTIICFSAGRCPTANPGCPPPNRD